MRFEEEKERRLIAEEYADSNNCSIVSDELLKEIKPLEKEWLTNLSGPKYYVDLDTAAYVAKWNGNGQVGIYTDSISGKDEFELHLTEQEIKDYDERYWAFAEPVEQVDFRLSF